jgi:hypothetical protein
MKQFGDAGQVSVKGVFGTAEGWHLSSALVWLFDFLLGSSFSTNAKAGDDSGQVTSADKLHPQVTSAIDNFGY